MMNALRETGAMVDDNIVQAGDETEQKNKKQWGFDLTRRKMMILGGSLAGAAGLGSVGSTGVEAQTIVDVPENEHLWPNPEDPHELSVSREQRENSLARHVNLVCSAVFMMDREVEEFFKNDLVDYRNQWFRWEDVDVEVDEEQETVTFVAPPDPPRTAAYKEGHGSSILPPGAREVSYEPVDVSPEPDEDQPWPMGDNDAVADSPEVDTDAISDTLEWAFETNQPETEYNRPHADYDSDRVTTRPDTRAIVVLHDGEIVGEKYDEEGGVDKEKVHVNWSMGKSLAPTLIGLLVHDGEFDIDDPAPIDEWQGDNDPRQEITISNIARMSSGLRFNRAADEDNIIYPTRNDDHSRAYFEAIDAYEYAANQFLEHEPGTVWAYRNVNPMLLGKIVRDTVEERGDNFLAYPQRALFDRIGCRNMIIQPDHFGNFIIQGYVYGSARDWARFGQLYLQDGYWQGERILPQGWADYVSTPAPADPDDGYGAMFWVNRGGAMEDVPEDAYWASGARDNWCVIIPSRDIVIVRLGRYAEYSQNELVRRILDSC